MQHNNISVMDKVIAIFSYLTVGFIGMIWFLINTLFIKKPMSNYLKYNLVQSFIISIFLAIFSLAYNIISYFLFDLGPLGNMFRAAHNFIFATPIFNTLTLVNFVLLAFVIYLSVIAFFGQLPYVPYITDVAKKIFD